MHLTPADQSFLETTLEELRDGESVTILGPLAAQARAWLEEQGATEEELARLTTVSPGGSE